MFFRRTVAGWGGFFPFGTCNFKAVCIHVVYGPFYSLYFGFIGCAVYIRYAYRVYTLYTRVPF
jgi:hypothetical protein